MLKQSDDTETHRTDELPAQTDQHPTGTGGINQTGPGSVKPDLLNHSASGPTCSGPRTDCFSSAGFWVQHGLVRESSVGSGF